MLDHFSNNPQTSGRSFVFTMNNLNVLKNPLIVNILRHAGHRLVYRSPYWPVDGEVEHKFDRIQKRLKVFFDQLTTMLELENIINLIVRAMQNVTCYFINAGFPP